MPLPNSSSGKTSGARKTKTQSGSLSSVVLRLGFIFGDHGTIEYTFPDHQGPDKIYDAHKFFRVIENGRRFKAWVKSNEKSAKKEFEENGVKHNQKAKQFDKTNVGILLPEFRGEMNGRRGVLWHGEAGTDVSSICNVIPSVKSFVLNQLKKKGSMESKKRDSYKKGVREKKIREIVRSEIKKHLNEADDVENVNNKVHEFWKELTVFNTKIAEKYFQDIATDLDKMQTTWDKSGRVKKEWMQLKQEFNSLIEGISRYKSFFKETMDSQSISKVEDTEDGYYRVERGGDYHET